MFVVSTWKEKFATNYVTFSKDYHYKLMSTPYMKINFGKRKSNQLGKYLSQEFILVCGS